MPPQAIGVLGGSGLYDLPGLSGLVHERVKTPFGEPSDRFAIGKLGDTTVVFLARHGQGHRLLPSELNVRANIHGMKQLGVTRLFSVSAVGSMKEEIPPGDGVVPDQIIDRTSRDEARSFFGGGIVAHVAFADPYCPELSAVLATKAAAVWSGNRIHRGGTYLCIDGPQFSARAESNLYRTWGVSVIGMTNATEARLAREAEICFATLALATDYDCWHAGAESVTVEQVIATMNRNVERAKAAIAGAAAAVPQARGCRCGMALEGAIMTRPDAISPAVRKRLALIVGHRIPAAPKRAAAKKKSRR
jgi:5'-methylthioadenosine phosphorylase